MSTNPTGLNIARQVAQVKANNPDRNSSRADSSPRADAFKAATAPTNSPPPVTTAVAAPGSAPAAPVGGTTVPTAGVRTAPNAPAPQMSTQAAAMAMATSGVFFAQVASAAAVTAGKKSSDASGKDESTDSIKATEADEKNQLALKDSNSQTGNEAGEISGANSANAPAA